MSSVTHKLIAFTAGDRVQEPVKGCLGHILGRSEVLQTSILTPSSPCGHTYRVRVLRHLSLGLENVVVEATRGSVQLVEGVDGLQDAAIVRRL